jgi:outer membrane protein assembly factor BamB
MMMSISLEAPRRVAGRLTGFSLAFVAGMLALLAAGPALAGEWPTWRGPWQNGYSPATGLIQEWDPAGKNLIWRQPWSGRSTPVVFDGRVCANGRAGEGELRQEAVACWDAATGKLLWERRFTVYLTQVPWNRVGWASLVADPETGQVFAQLVGGSVVALDKSGKTTWEWRSYEDFNRQSGYGGRTNTPVVDQDLVIVHTISAAWGNHAGMADRYVALDKRTGTIRWVSPKGERPQDLNTYSVPVIAMLDGQRVMVAGGADGYVRALKTRTGEEVWRFHLSQRGLNASVVIDGDTVFASHSEENVDTTNVMGRLVAINAKGAQGDVTKTAEIWRVDDLDAGYASPLIHDGILYVPDNSANLWAFSAKDGKNLWKLGYGTVGKGSPVWSGGLLYLTEVNGHVAVIDPKEPKVLNEVQITMPGEARFAEVYGSVAPAYGRVYFTTEEGVYCLGDAKAKFAVAQDEGIESTGLFRIVEDKPAADAKVAKLQVVPAVHVGMAAQPVQFKVYAFDDKGRALGERKDATFALKGLPGAIGADGKLTVDAAKVRNTQHGQVEAKVGELTAVAELRMAAALPWSEDFEGLVDKAPPGFLGGSPNKGVKDLDGSKVFVLPKPPGGAPRATVFLGPSSMKGYTIQADVRGNAEGRRMTDVGLVVNGFNVVLLGAYQQIQVDNWEAERRMMKQFPFAWQPGVWYTMKARVDYEGGKGVVRAKVWPRGSAEPAAWTVEVTDPLPPDSGSPGLYAFVPVEAYYDNITVTAN